MTNEFSENSYLKCAGESIPRRFSKNSKLSMPLDQQLEILNALCFYCMPQSKTPNCIRTKMLTTCFCLIKQKEIFSQYLWFIFSMTFE